MLAVFYAVEREGGKNGPWVFAGVANDQNAASDIVKRTVEDEKDLMREKGRHGIRYSIIATGSTEDESERFIITEITGYYGPMMHAKKPKSSSITVIHFKARVCEFNEIVNYAPDGNE